MSNSIALISLIILIACIAIGFVLKKNVGLIAILAAAIFGSVAGYSDSAIIKGFSSSTFIMLLGVSLLCTIATNNGTLELAAKKFLRLTGGINQCVLLISCNSLFNGKIIDQNAFRRDR